MDGKDKSETRRNPRISQSQYREEGGLNYPLSGQGGQGGHHMVGASLAPLTIFVKDSISHAHHLHLGKLVQSRSPY